MGRTIGVSKPCCPTCARLLDILSESEDLARPFTFRASHGNITGCSLPPWLPTEIHKKMVKEFGKELKQHLETFKMIENALQTNQPNSPDSDGRSESSIDNDIDELYDDILEDPVQ